MVTRASKPIILQDFRIHKESTYVLLLSKLFHERKQQLKESVKGYAKDLNKRHILQQKEKVRMQ